MISLKRFSILLAFILYLNASPYVKGSTQDQSTATERNKKRNPPPKKGLITTVVGTVLILGIKNNFSMIKETFFPKKVEENSTPIKEFQNNTAHSNELAKEKSQNNNVNSIGSLYGLEQNELAKEILDIFYERLYPKSSSSYGSETGFLQKGEKLQGVVEKDRQTLMKYGVSYEKIYQELSAIIDAAEDEKAKKPFGESSESEINVTVNQKKFAVKIESFRGFQYCPFSLRKEDSYTNLCGRGSKDITITNIQKTDKNGKNLSIKVGSLLPHLIRDHHFFEGDVPYRVSPKDIIETLGIEKEEKPQFPPPNTLSKKPELIN